MPDANNSADDQPVGESSGQDLDITTRQAGDEIEAAEVPIYSRLWAEVVRPFTFFIFILLAAVILIPFLFVFVDDVQARNTVYDWSKTILAPVVGFASAAVGYYYGTRQAGTNALVSDDTPSNHSDD